MARISIVGGGVIGLSIAYECQKRGHELTIVEALECGGQASGAAAGMLAPYSEIEEDPDDFFRLCQRSLQLFPSWQNEIKQSAQIDFEYNESGSLYCIFHEADRLSLETKKSWQKKFGVESFILSGDEVRQKEPDLSDEIVAGLWCPEESHIYAPDYVSALLQACRNTGVRVIEHAGEATLGEDNEVITEHYEIEADYTVIATGAWAMKWEDKLGFSLPVYPIRGQICAYEGPSLKHIIFTSQGYLVSKENGSLVSGASEDIAGFNTDVTTHGIRRLERWSKKIVPKLLSETPFHTWAGLRPATQDGFPLIGRLQDSPRIILATGHYRNGILLSPVTAKIVADEIEGKTHDLAIGDFRPERFQYT
ncbi:glycine oxidase ThiO [Guptibacillus hwajinpoensis]|uniref:glycine oxidase n=1 Tax=Guptibacillus hwajinpoensis TaxID=208199 RepID=A0ABU0JX50_9BACL|nr:glycine oxidase ThiO [Alkalihalobacillus hemicentroti]MDQ0481665.1 glycine oxidase [Alkalihalobacillus hemicentroti]